MIMALLKQGIPQLMIRAIFNVGGYRVTRLSV